MSAFKVQCGIASLLLIYQTAEQGRRIKTRRFKPFNFQVSGDKRGTKAVAEISVIYHEHRR